MDGDAIPSPSKLSDIHPEEIARELDPEAPLARRLSIWCLFTIPAWLNAAALDIHLNHSS